MENKDDYYDHTSRKLVPFFLFGIHTVWMSNVDLLHRIYSLNDNPENLRMTHEEC